MSRKSFAERQFDLRVEERKQLAEALAEVERLKHHAATFDAAAQIHLAEVERLKAALESTTDACTLGGALRVVHAALDGSAAAPRMFTEEQVRGPVQAIIDAWEADEIGQVDGALIDDLKALMEAKP